MVAAQTGALEGAPRGLVQLPNEADAMSALGHEPIFHGIIAMLASPLKADIDRGKLVVS